MRVRTRVRICYGEFYINRDSNKETNLVFQSLNHLVTPFKIAGLSLTSIEFKTKPPKQNNGQIMKYKYSHFIKDYRKVSISVTCMQGKVSNAHKITSTPPDKQTHKSMTGLVVHQMSLNICLVNLFNLYSSS